MDPVAEDLPIHTAQGRCLAARQPVQHMRQSQHAPGRVRIVRASRFTAKLRRRVVRSCDRNRRCHLALPESTSSGSESCQHTSGNPRRVTLACRWYESGHSVEKVVEELFADKPEKLAPVPDIAG